MGLDNAIQSNLKLKMAQSRPHLMKQASQRLRSRFAYRNPEILLRKEVIQPHLPVGLPCYDLVPLTSHTFADTLLAVGQPTSGATHSGDLTGGVYKTRERIHPDVADVGLLTIPASRRRVAAFDPNWARFLGISSTSRFRNPLCRAL